MQIEEIIRSCANEMVALAAVSSIGGRFYREVRDAADTFGMSVGGFTVFAVDRFAHRGDEGEMRAVALAMSRAQEPLLAGLYRILCITLAARGLAPNWQTRPLAPLTTVRAYALEAGARRERFF